MLTLDSYICRTSHPLSTEIDGEVVILETSKGNYYTLDAIGADIWQRIAAPAQVGALCAELHAKYDAEIAVIRRDVLAVLVQMVDEGLIEVTSPGS